ncbi:hypothetical protein [Ferrovum sp.]|uniref:hypothetical protein n=1 Tax=Ferrovum sp. TaxID=2609467 RepID=UPI00345583BD
MIFEAGNLHPSTPHLFADLAELLLLSRWIGRSTLHKNDLKSLINQGVISSEEIDEEESAEEEARQTNCSTAEISSRMEKQLDDVFIQLNYRMETLKENYPFSIVGETISLKESLTGKERIYRLLLSCSRLRSFNKRGVAQRWAEHFTKLSKIAMKGLVPNHASVRIFDANSDDRRTHYTTDLRKALKRLGKEIGALHILESECDNAGASGDAGLDLVAIIDFEDNAAINYALFGQSGAQETGWPNKTLEAHAFRYRNYFHMQFDYPGLMFTPVLYRDSQGAWVDNQATNGILLIDRQRMLKLLSLQNQWQSIVTEPWFAQFETEFAELSTTDTEE